ncbi:hypothetical protein [Pseudomonas sp. PD9R]|uniref:hypothetical protein n=1 Tax=Pseudomonas sp. PD9R TaxID=2853534 RepID=UPI001C47241F|nr:hypothetical protein [Pseudomonas sp. PD9R]MBV6823861.1 hypothetical protein [Pseudomonas sp. PD9R]
MSKREQLRRIRKNLDERQGNPIERAIEEVMDWCEAMAFEPKAHMTWDELEAAEAETIELLALLEGFKSPQAKPGK